MDRPDTEIVVPDQHLPKQYYLLLKKIEFFSRKHRCGKTMMIFDEINEQSDRKISEAMTGFFFRTNLGRSFSHVLEMPLFVSSGVTPSIQLADIFAGIVRHYYERGLDQHTPSGDYEEWLKSHFEQLFARTENNPVPGTEFIEYGFQRISDLGYRHNENTVLTKSE